MIKATGRYFCDFLQSVDNIHLQMRFTYRKMKSPSMQITDIDDTGAILIYRSTRSGFSKYLMGRIYLMLDFSILLYILSLSRLFHSLSAWVLSWWYFRKELWTILQPFLKTKKKGNSWRLQRKFTISTWKFALSRRWMTWRAEVQEQLTSHQNQALKMSLWNID